MSIYYSVETMIEIQWGITKNKILILVGTRGLEYFVISVNFSDNPNDTPHLHMHMNIPLETVCVCKYGVLSSGLNRHSGETRQGSSASRVDQAVHFSEAPPGRSLEPSRQVAQASARFK